VIETLGRRNPRDWHLGVLGPGDLVVATPRMLSKKYGITHEGVADRVRELVSRRAPLGAKE